MQAQKLCQAQVQVKSVISQNKSHGNGISSARQTAASKLATHVLNSQFTISNLGLDKGCGVKDFFCGDFRFGYCGKKIKKNH